MLVRPYRFEVPGGRCGWQKNSKIEGQYVENFKPKKIKTPAQVKEAARIKSAFGEATRTKVKRGPKRSI